jgi:hypothetical protein
MKYLPREVAFGKLKAMADGRRQRAAGAGMVSSPSGSRS